MKECIYKILGRMLTAIEMLHRSFRHTDYKEELDKTGRFVKNAKRLKILWNDSDVLFADYGSLSHSFWRAQESSLFRKHKEELKSPILDLGCGDGSFSSVLFKEIDYGVDHDPEVLKIAEGFGVYKKLLSSTASSIPMEDGLIQSVIANSVLEHLKELNKMLSEISRIIAKDGLFMFTVPISQFKEDLKKYFGKKESERVNLESYHRNLLSVKEWEEILRKHGFSVGLIKQYQPDWFTFWYKMLRLVGSLAIFLPQVRALVWKHYKDKLIEMVLQSISKTESGANIFVIARKL